MKHVHLIGVAGTGMGALAGLLCKAGYRVTGSDVAFYPPMGDKLTEWGVEVRSGFDPAHLEPTPDCVVVGNVCRRDNPEAQAALARGLPCLSMPALLEQLFLSERRSFVVAGTHGKTTTTALVTHLLRAHGVTPGYLLGGVPRDLPDSFDLGASDAPFVIEGDEYDSAFFEKQPKFFRYHPKAAILTSIEHDHIDIYPTLDSYRAAFEGFVARIPRDGVLIAYAGCPEVRRVAQQAACTVRYYALDRDETGDVAPEWLAAPAPASEGEQAFDLFYGGSSSGRVFTRLAGMHNLRNALAAMALCAEAAGLGVTPLSRTLQTFRGVRRRQELVATADGVRVYDDFAHHPTAVRETLRGLRERHPAGKLIALFEPRSATASRRLHQDVYPSAFASADVSMLAPVGRPEIAEDERLDVFALARGIEAQGKHAFAPLDHESLVRRTLAEAAPGDTIVVMSNGNFNGVLDRLVAGLTLRTATQLAEGSAP